MSRLPVLSGREVARAFQRDDWQIARQHGSHLILVKKGRKEILSVPLHRTLDRGTLRSLIRAARLTVEEFTALL